MGSRIKPHRPILQRGHPLARGMVCALAFWERGGTSTRDLVAGRGTTFTNITASDWVTQQLGAAISSVGGPRYITVSAPLLTNPGSESMWIYLRSRGAGSSEPNILRSDSHYWGINGTTGRLEFFSGGWQAASSGDVTTGVWHHVAITHTPAETRQYLDGVLVHTSASIVSAGGATVQWGGRSDGSGIDGYIADCRQWNRAIGHDEVLALHRDPWAMYRPAGRGTLANTLQSALPRRLMQTVGPQNLQHLTF